MLFLVFVAKSCFCKGFGGQAALLNYSKFDLAVMSLAQIVPFSDCRKSYFMPGFGCETVLFT